ncbi:hypothetical protein GGH96_000932 [Coemansia sp. RSA 1972]|nr:hypothetical protein GGH96_000932 [Coemansia sp. RSA 1972]
MPAFSNYRQPKQFESDSDSELSDCNSGAGSEDEFIFREQHPESVRDASSTGQTLQLRSAALVVSGNRRKTSKMTKAEIDMMMDGLTRIKISDDELIDTPSEMTVPLMEHQREGIAWMVRNEQNKKRRGGLLGDDMGMGKTVQALALMVANKPKPGRSHATLVVAPASTVYQWEKEALKLFKDGTFNRIIVYHGPNRNKLVDSFADCDLVITTFDIVSIEWGNPKTEKMFDLDANERKQRDKHVQELTNSPLFWTSWRRLIIDEAHQLRNYETKKSMACCDLVARYRWMLSGTPIQNDLTDVYSVLRFLRIQPYCRYSKFDALKCHPDRGLGTVRSYLQALMLRRTKASQKKTSLLQLPPRYSYIHRLAMSPKMVQTSHLCADLVLAPNVDIVQETDKHNPTDKTVIFSEHITMIELLSSFLAANGFANAMYYGKHNMFVRNKTLTDFSSNANTRVLLVSKHAGYSGINLTAANHVIIESLWWNPTVDEQAADRVYRIGQTKPVHVHTLISQNTFDEKMYEIQEARRKLINDVVGDAAAKSDNLTHDEKMSILASSFYD